MTTLSRCSLTIVGPGMDPITLRNVLADLGGAVLLDPVVIAGVRGVALRGSFKLGVSVDDREALDRLFASCGAPVPAAEAVEVLPRSEAGELRREHHWRERQRNSMINARVKHQARTMRARRR